MYENDELRTTSKGTHYHCGHSECEESVLHAVQQPRVEHREYGHLGIRKTLYCSNECLHAALGDAFGKETGDLPREVTEEVLVDSDAVDAGASELVQTLSESPGVAIRVESTNTDAIVECQGIAGVDDRVVAVGGLPEEDPTMLTTADIADWIDSDSHSLSLVPLKETQFAGENGGEEA